jgi:hypothetical protein
MSTRAFASTVINAPITKVWKALRDFTFPGKFFQMIDVCEMVDGVPPTTVGSDRIVKWKTGDTRTQKLITLDDQFHSSVWELVTAEPPVEVEAIITTLRCYRVSSTNSTLVTWESDFSAGVSQNFVNFEQNAYAQNLEEIKTILESSK